jgi:hypothetical protein
MIFSLGVLAKPNVHFAILYFYVLLPEQEVNVFPGHPVPGKGRRPCLPGSKGREFVSCGALQRSSSGIGRAPFRQGLVVAVSGATFLFVSLPALFLDTAFLLIGVALAILGVATGLIIVPTVSVVRIIMMTMAPFIPVMMVVMVPFPIIIVVPMMMVVMAALTPVIVVMVTVVPVTPVVVLVVRMVAVLIMPDGGIVVVLMHSRRVLRHHQ